MNIIFNDNKLDNIQIALTKLKNTPDCILIVEKNKKDFLQFSKNKNAIILQILKKDYRFEKCYKTFDDEINEIIYNYHANKLDLNELKLVKIEYKADNIKNYKNKNVYLKYSEKKIKGIKIFCIGVMSINLTLFILINESILPINVFIFPLFLSFFNFYLTMIIWRWESAKEEITDPNHEYISPYGAKNIYPLINALITIMFFIPYLNL